MHSLINNNPTVDCIEEEYENCLLKSVINELNTSFDATKASSLDLSPSSEFDDDSDVSRQNLTKKALYHHKKMSSPLTTKDTYTLLNNLKGTFASLIVGKHSNYYISDLIRKCTKKQKLSILREIYSQIDKLAINEYGTHPIQTFVEHASSKDELIMLITSKAQTSSFFQHLR